MRDNIFEMMVWEWQAPTNPAEQGQFLNDLGKLDLFLLTAISDECSQPHGDLIQCYRGWNNRHGRHTSTMVSLFQWMNPDDEARFKDAREHCKISCSSANLNSLYEDSLLPAMKDLTHRGWIQPKQQVHFRLIRECVWSFNAVQDAPSSDG